MKPDLYYYMCDQGFRGQKKDEDLRLNEFEWIGHNPLDDELD